VEFFKESLETKLKRGPDHRSKKEKKRRGVPEKLDKGKKRNMTQCVRTKKIRFEFNQPGWCVGVAHSLDPKRGKTRWKKPKNKKRTRGEKKRTGDSVERGKKARTGDGS